MENGLFLVAGLILVLVRKKTSSKNLKKRQRLDVVVEKLLAVFDKKMHQHPPQLFYTYKIVLFCKAVSSEIKKVSMF